MIDGEAKRTERALRLAKISRHMQCAELENRATRRTDPGNRMQRVRRVGPRENAIAISGNKPLGRQIGVQADETVLVGGVG